MKIGAFKRRVWNYYRTQRRALPWRNLSSLSHARRAYYVLVSEIMLQQTQAERVIPKYRAFVKRFPTVATLADADFREVLSLWQGLGYNRRARMLHRAARMIMEEHHGKIPRDEMTLRNLPGIGPYTAGAICTFAYNLPAVIIETNIRSVFIHFFFSDSKAKIKDTDILPYIRKTLDRKRAAEWYSALMDYGSMLKRQGSNPSRKSSNYKRQSPYRNSDREIRGAIIRTLLQGTCPILSLTLELQSYGRRRVLTQLCALSREDMIIVKRGAVSVA